MIQEKKVYDITVIGGGPVGLFTAFYAGMRELSVNIIESLPQLGGQLAALYPEKYIYDIAGFPKIKAKDLVNNLVEQMAMFEQTINLGQTVQVVEKQPNGEFLVHTESDSYLTKTIIITAGNGAFDYKRLPHEKAGLFEGKNLSYFIDDLQKFANKKVCLFGGGDSAVDWAMMLEPIAEKVTIVHRRDKFRAHESTVTQMMNSKVEVLTPFNPKDFIGSDRIEEVIIEHTKGEEDIQFVVDDVIVNYGFSSSLGPIKSWGLEIEKNSILVNSKMETNIEGIYAAGDICTYEGKVKLIATGFGEAPIAVSNAKTHIDPSAKLQALHSTSLMENKENEKTTV
ncbi:NAD(P)/FAD-dependent oxidoreductase [Sporosarcina sp. GW1-11]|uniref:NAD(P)/FAD-dependent oxidoreductase n=1 Tax=Sporosarcina sp. GW1-11 TaxID=2899126 RepID=UPI00294F567D|nr:NAD(P)/FAD-dependent oxidoreductase [Sporosarcina sp. GW1-11]MDV6377454.1 NAD(P)/FAD-dependent oxidoreductase [Sporosarcina sp. GW1-11]